MDILKKDKKWIRRHINGKRIAMVFQDPMTSLNPTMNIAIALSCNPDLLICDEPTTALDVTIQAKIMEKGTINEIFYDPRHPYTWGLLSAMPDLDTDDERLYTIPGSTPNLLHEKVGDAFAPRNRYALEVDDKAEPPMFRITDTHYAATWLLDSKAPKVEMPEGSRQDWIV